MINYSDLLASIRDYKLLEILESNEDPENNPIVVMALEESVGIVRDFLFSRYNTETVFSATGSERNSTILGWLRDIALYKIYKRIPDELLPEHIVDDYKMAMKLLGYVSEGRQEIGIPRRLTQDGIKTTKFRGGGSKPRSYN